MGELERADPISRQEAYTREQRIKVGVVKRINPETQTMEVQLAGVGNLVTVRLNNPATLFGLGVRMMPIENITRVLVYVSVAGDYTHIGYALEGTENFIDNRQSSKNAPSGSNILLQRYLEPGEIEMVGMTGNEIFLPKEGSIYIKSQFGDYLLLDNFESTFRGSFSNLSFEMDEITLRSGNIIRSVKENTAEENTTEDEYIVGVDSYAKKESDLTEEELERAQPLKEFLIRVGTDIEDPSSIPTIGTFFLGSMYVDETGDENVTGGAGKSVNFKIQTASGGGLSINEDGSVFIMDVLGGDGTRFDSAASGETEGGEKSFRVGNNMLSIAADRITLIHESGSMLEIDNQKISLQHTSGRYVLLDADNGFFVGCPGAMASFQAKTFNVMASTTNFGMMPVDSLLSALITAATFDTHFHAGPVGPPVVPWTPLVMGGVMTVSGINVSV